MVSAARRTRTDWAATRIAEFIGLVFRMLWSVAAGLILLVFLVTPLPLLRKATHFFLATASRLTSSTPITGGSTDDWVASRVFALPEMWCLIARQSGLVGAWRLKGVCWASHQGVEEWLRTLPGLVMCGGRVVDSIDGRCTSEVWRLDLATLRWRALPALMTARHEHACCTVRGALVVLGGLSNIDVDGKKYEHVWKFTSTVETLSARAVGVFTSLPSLSCDHSAGAFAIAVEESISIAGQVLLIGGRDGWGGMLSMVELVDLATGTCTPQPATLDNRVCFTAVRIPDGRIVCAGGGIGTSAKHSTEVWGPPEGEAPSAMWTWTGLPSMNVGRTGCCGCVMSDGRFAVLGGYTNNGPMLSSCEALKVGADEHWTLLPPMHHARLDFVCAAVARCIIVAGGSETPEVEMYDEDYGRWLQLPCNFPGAMDLIDMGSALM